MTNSRSTAFAICAATLLACGTAHADGNAEAGKSKAISCLGCHGIPGYDNVYPSFKVPKLAGQHSAYIVAALNAYKTGQREHKTMVAQASSLSDQDMQDIAAYFASIASGGN